MSMVHVGDCRDLRGDTIQFPLNYTFIASLRIEQTSNGKCVAVLIAPSVLLTLAQCDEDVKWACIGSEYFDGDCDGELIPVIEHVEHPKFDEAIDLDYDFAIFRLEFPSTFSPITISWVDEPIGSTAWVLGFKKNTSVFEMQRADIWHSDACELVFRELRTDSMMCAVIRERNTGIDSLGSALTIESAQHGHVLVGLSSWSTGYGKHQANVFSRVAVARQFIEKYSPNS